MNKIVKRFVCPPEGVLLPVGIVFKSPVKQLPVMSAVTPILSRRRRELLFAEMGYVMAVIVVQIVRRIVPARGIVLVLLFRLRRLLSRYAGTHSAMERRIVQHAYWIVPVLFLGKPAEAVGPPVFAGRRSNVPVHALIIREEGSGMPVMIAAARLPARVRL